MALPIRTFLAVALLIACFELNTCIGNKEITNDPAAVWLLQASEPVEKVDRDNSLVYTESKADDRVARPIGSHRLNNRFPSQHGRPYNLRGNDQRNKSPYPKRKNPDLGRQSATFDTSKRQSNNEIHIEVDNLDQVGDFLNELLNNDDVDVQINTAPGTVDIRPPQGKKPDVTSGVHSKRRPSLSTYTPRPTHTTTGRPVIRTLPPVGRRPSVVTPKPPSLRGPSTTKDPFENFWLPSSTTRVQTFESVTPQEGDLSKQTTVLPGAAPHESSATRTIDGQESSFSQSSWEWFKHPFWGPPLALTSSSPATTTEPTKPHSKKNPIKDSVEEDEELDEEGSEEEDDEDDEDDSKSRQIDEDERPLPSNQAPVVATPVAPKSDYYGVQPYPIPATNYYTPLSPVRLDFSPLFLALIPIALFLGAAASFALSSAVTSSSAVATAQQQQQQQEENNNNNANNANSNNANTILELLTALSQNNNNGGYFNNFPYFVVVNDTSIIGRRRRRRAKRHIELLD